MQCLNCGSYECRSNKIDPAAFVQAIAASHPRPPSPGGAMAIWGGVHFLNSFRKDWVCDNCGFKF